MISTEEWINRFALVLEASGDYDRDGSLTQAEIVHGQGTYELKTPEAAAEEYLDLSTEDDEDENDEEQ